MKSPIALLMVLLVTACEKSEVSSHGDSLKSKASGQDIAKSDRNGELMQSEDLENKRTRPPNPPPDRVYPKPKPEPYPTAAPLDGKVGFVASPYSGNSIDVRDIRQGTLVADPAFPPGERKYFRVP